MCWFKGLAAAFLVAIALPARGETIIHDTFELNGTTRVVRGLLAGTAPEFGVGTWRGHPFFRFGEDEVLAETSTQFSPFSGSAYLPFDLAQYPNHLLRVSADLNPQYFPGTEQVWTGIGFLSRASGLQDIHYPPAATVWTLIQEYGNFQAFANGRQIADRIIPVRPGYNHVELDYNTRDKTLSISVNGRLELDAYSLGAGFVPDFESVGIGHLYNGVNNGPRSLFDNFEVAAVPVPEPDAALLWSAGIVCLAAARFLRRFRRAGEEDPGVADRD